MYKTFLDLKNNNKGIKDRILKEIRNFFEHEKEENFYKPVRAYNFWSNNYIEYESRRNRNETQSVK